MTICVKCRKEMRCYKTGLGARFGADHVYAGDAYECPDCGVRIIKAVDVPTHDPDKRINAIDMPAEVQ